MKKTLIIITLLLASNNANAQHPRQSTRPQWSGYYNGQGLVPGYSYNPRSGWNTVTSPNGNIMHYRDGYVPMQGVTRNAHGPYGVGNYNNVPQNNYSPGYNLSPRPRPRYRSKYYSTEPMESYADKLERLGG